MPHVVRRYPCLPLNGFFVPAENVLGRFFDLPQPLNLSEKNKDVAFRRDSCSLTSEVNIRHVPSESKSIQITLW